MSGSRRHDDRRSEAVADKVRWRWAPSQVIDERDHAHDKTGTSPRLQTASLTRECKEFRRLRPRRPNRPSLPTSSSVALPPLVEF